jgi:hypothetical protein
LFSCDFHTGNFWTLSRCILVRSRVGWVLAPTRGNRPIIRVGASTHPTAYHGAPNTRGGLQGQADVPLPSTAEHPVGASFTRRTSPRRTATVGCFCVSRAERSNCQRTARMEAWSLCACRRHAVAVRPPRPDAETAREPPGLVGPAPGNLVTERPPVPRQAPVSIDPAASAARKHGATFGSSAQSYTL